MKPSNTTTSGKATDIIAGICTFPRLRSPSQKRHVMLNLTSTWVCNANFETRMRGWGPFDWVLFWRMLLSLLLWCSDDRRKNTRTRTPCCIADRPTAGIEALPHYHQLLVCIYTRYNIIMSLPVYVGPFFMRGFFLEVANIIFSPSN